MIIFCVHFRDNATLFQECIEADRKVIFGFAFFPQILFGFRSFSNRQRNHQLLS
jgi:capsid portal protein